MSGEALSDEQIDELIERSSLGALAAKAYRDLVSDDQVDEVMRRLATKCHEQTPT